MTFSKKALIGIVLGSIAGVTSCMDNSEYMNSSVKPVEQEKKQEEMNSEYQLSTRIKKCDLVDVTRIIKKAGGIDIKFWPDSDEGLLFAILPDSTVGVGLVQKEIKKRAINRECFLERLP